MTLKLVTALIAGTVGFSDSAFAASAIDCQMNANPCTLSGAYIELPWDIANYPDPSASAYRTNVNEGFVVSYGYEQATGSYEQGNLMIRDEDPRMGAYWGLVGSDSKYFAVIVGNPQQGFKVGIKGCADSPRVWSSSCQIAPR